jgi:hypothetical protein
MLRLTSGACSVGQTLRVDHSLQSRPVRRWSAQPALTMTEPSRSPIMASRDPTERRIPSIAALAASMVTRLPRRHAVRHRAKPALARSPGSGSFHRGGDPFPFVARSLPAQPRPCSRSPLVAGAGNLPQGRPHSRSVACPSRGQGLHRLVQTDEDRVWGLPKVSSGSERPPSACRHRRGPHHYRTPRVRSWLARPYGALRPVDRYPRCTRFREVAPAPQFPKTASPARLSRPRGPERSGQPVCSTATLGCVRIGVRAICPSPQPARFEGRRARRCPRAPGGVARGGSWSHGRRTRITLRLADALARNPTIDRRVGPPGADRD